MGDAFHGMEDVRREKLCARWNATIALYQDTDNAPALYDFLSQAVDDLYRVNKESSHYLLATQEKCAPKMERIWDIDAEIETIRHPSLSRCLQLLFKKDRTLYAIGQVRTLIREKKTAQAEVAKLKDGVRGIAEVASISNKLGFIYDGERGRLLRQQLGR
jgi:hypothetical protein